MPGMCSLRQAVIDAGGNSVVAGRLGVSEQRLSNWIDRGVPVNKCAAMERAVEGRYTRWQMRPLDWSEIWPELVDRRAERAEDTTITGLDRGEQQGLPSAPAPGS